MKVASNRIEHISDLYYSQLGDLYDKNEIQAILQIVYEHYLGFRKHELSARKSENVNQSDLLKLYDCCMRLKTGEPLQYILHEAWFMGLRFYVDKRVLIPRPETEELVDMIVKQADKNSSVLDIGTGSGCIPVSVKHLLPECVVSACDISEEALEVAAKNAAVNRTDVRFMKADVLETPEFVRTVGGPFDLVISNPPYIKAEEKSSLHKNVVDHEPHLALFVNSNDEIIFYKRIIDACEKILKPEGSLYFELNPLTSDEVSDFARAKGYFGSVEIVNDMQGKPRMMRARKK